MVHITHPTVFSLPDSLQSSSGRWCSDLLQLSAQVLVVSASLLDCGSVKERRFPAAVIRSGKEAYPAVHADDIRYVIHTEDIDVFCHRDVKKELTVPADKSGSPEASVQADAFGEERDSDPSVNGVHRKERSVPGQGVIPVPDKIYLRFFK